MQLGIDLFAVCLQMFKNKAVEIADKLLPAFNTPTGIPMAMVNGRTYVYSLVFM